MANEDFAASLRVSARTEDEYKKHIEEQAKKAEEQRKKTEKKNLYNSFDGVVPTSLPKISKNSNVGV